MESDDSLWPVASSHFCLSAVPKAHWLLLAISKLSWQWNNSSGDVWFFEFIYLITIVSIYLEKKTESESKNCSFRVFETPKKPPGFMKETLWAVTWLLPKKLVTAVTYLNQVFGFFITVVKYQNQVFDFENKWDNVQMQVLFNF